MLITKENGMQKIVVGDYIEFGQYRWKVLDIEDNQALLISEHIVVQQPYNDVAGPVTWETCSLRKYLNGTFYNTFTPSEQKRISLSYIKNDNNQWYKSDGGEDTEDYIFLLSVEELTCLYFGDSSYNLTNPSAKQRYWFQRKDKNNTKRQVLYEGSSWWWWTRSPGRDNKRAVYVHGDGNIGIQGNGTYRYSSKTIHPLTKDNAGGVRPALWLSID